MGDYMHLLSDIMDLPWHFQLLLGFVPFLDQPQGSEALKASLSPLSLLFFYLWKEVIESVTHSNILLEGHNLFFDICFWQGKFAL